MTDTPESARALAPDLFRGDVAVVTGGGTGLGLSLSHDIVVQGHGGTLGVASNVGEGATFTVVLPVRR